MAKFLNRFFWKGVLKMENALHEKLQSITRTLRLYVVVLFTLSLVISATLVSSTLWDKAWALYALTAYLMLTAGMIVVGHAIKKIPLESIRDEFNQLYQRTAVIVLNGIVGTTSLAIAALTDLKRMTLALTIASIFYALYAVSYCSGLIAPNSFCARFRSVMSRILIVMIICETMWPESWQVIMIPGLLALSISGQSLFVDYKKGLFPFR